MSSYDKFAHVYDSLMTDIPYVDYVKWVSQNAPVNEYPKLLDVACGTGTLSVMFKDKGYDVIGTDLSEEMLTIANERLIKAGYTVPLICQSMDELNGFSNFDVVVIAIDSLNYLSDEASVKSTFQNVYDTLREGGQLFFDVHSLFKVNEIFLNSPFTFENEEMAYIWFTEEGEQPHSVYHDLTFFVKTVNGLYERFEETHFQRTFVIDHYKKWLEDIGFKSIQISSDWSQSEPTEESERIFFRVVK